MLRSSALATFMIGGVAAQNLQVVTGILVDQQDAPIPAVQVLLVRSGFTRQVQTAADGTFRFERVPLADYELQITLAGFDSL